MTETSLATTVSVYSVVEMRRRSMTFLRAHSVNDGVGDQSSLQVAGKYGLRRGQETPDLYGMIDAVYTSFALGVLSQGSNRASRQQWARQILDCQDHKGWFSKRNLRGHSPEHATGYAIGALMLLGIEEDEDYLVDVKPLEFLLPILGDENAFSKWINALGFQPSTTSILNKRLGWHYIWSGSHVGGGIAAIIGMTHHLFNDWWSSPIDTPTWFRHYFEWLNAHVNSDTGYWQRAFWNTVYRKPTLIDMGGAVHFLWIYEAMGRPFPYPEAIIKSTLSLQRSTGLYKGHPFCIDLDGNFCLVRAYLQLAPERQLIYRDRVYRAAERNFEAVVKALTTRPLEEIYTDSHGLPGALAALVECTKLPDFKYTEAMAGWQHPLDRAWWL